jgi:hypothetical protein
MDSVCKSSIAEAARYAAGSAFFDFIHSADSISMRGRIRLPPSQAYRSGA